MSDILVPIGDEHLPELSDIYKKNSEAPPYVHSFLETMQRWKRSGKPEIVTLWSPNDCWREDGTFIALMQFGNYDLFMFTLNPKCKHLCEGIVKTKRINWTNPTLIFNLHSMHYPFLLEAFRGLDMVANFNIIHDMYFLDKDEALKFDVECLPTDVYLKKLDESIAPIIDYLYKPHRHRFPDSDKFISTLIELNGGYGLFFKKNDDLAAFVLKTCLGQIGFLQTVEQYRKRGYGEYLLKVMSRDIAEEGFIPMGAISHDNVASLNLFRKLGFQLDGVCYFLEECHNEILMNIPDEDLDTLAEMYKENEEIPYASAMITFGMKVKKTRSFFIRFMSPGNSWREDGTFLVVMDFPHRYDLALFTLDKKCTNVYEGLTQTKRLHFGRPLSFYAVHDIIYPTVLKVLEEKDAEIRSDELQYIFTIPKEKALEFQIECPSDVILKKLTPLHSKTIDVQWAQKFANSQEFLSSLIDHAGGWGIFLKTNNKLASWGLLMGSGQIGIIQTIEGHRKKGYACIIAKVLSKTIAELEENPTVTVPVDNVPARNMFKKLGFENKGQCHYISLEKSRHNTFSESD